MTSCLWMSNSSPADCTADLFLIGVKTLFWFSLIVIYCFISWWNTGEVYDGQTNKCPYRLRFRAVNCEWDVVKSLVVNPKWWAWVALWDALTPASIKILTVSEMKDQVLIVQLLLRPTATQPIWIQHEMTQKTQHANAATHIDVHSTWIHHTSVLIAVLSTI